MDISDLLAFSTKNNASDLHLSAGLPPMIRVDGDIRRINMPELEHKEVHAMIYDIMNDKQRKDFEEFFTDAEDLDMERFKTVGVIRNQPEFNETDLDNFMSGIEELREKGAWDKEDIVKLYFSLLPEFAHKEKGKYLDERM